MLTGWWKFDQDIDWDFWEIGSKRVKFCQNWLSQNRA